MSTSTIDIPTTDGVLPRVHDPSVRRSAFYIEGRGEPFFAWLHQPAGQRHIDHGVVICAPIGHEQLHSHRSLRYLADRLAQDSIPTLRFDWHGTGDSPGIDEDPRRYATWLANIRDAATWMRTRLGCRRISLIGLRVGATFAALSAAEDVIDNLVLWCPVVKGRTYVREMKAISLTSGGPAVLSHESSNEIEAAGFTLSSDCVEELSAIDLMKCHPGCKRVLVVTRAELSENDLLSNHWASIGIHVQQISVPGYTEMMDEPHHSKVPHSAILQIGKWLKSRIDVEARKAVKSDDQWTQAIMIPHTICGTDSRQDVGPIRESIFEISNKPRLFGVVVEPGRSVVEKLPTLVLLNAGSAHRIGPSRLNVLISRRLAAQGFRCVRIDFSGLGDSILPDDEIAFENDPYPATAFRDVELTMQAVEQRFASKRIILMGLCSGAYAAFQSAAQISNPALVESVLINPLTYFWKEGMTLETSPTKQLMSYHYYSRAAFDPKRWLKFLSGNSKIGVGGAIRLMAQRFGLMRTYRDVPDDSDTELRRTTGPSHPTREDLRGDLNRIVQANRRLSMFFSLTDPGFSILNHHAKRKLGELREMGRVTIGFVEGADHTFTKRKARNTLIDAIAVSLSNRYLKN